MQSEILCTVYMFINSSSGGGVGKQLLNTEVSLTHSD